MIIDCHVHLSQFGHEGQSYAEIRDSLLSSMEQSGIAMSFVLADSEPNTLVSDLDITCRVVDGYPRWLWSSFRPFFVLEYNRDV